MNNANPGQEIPFGSLPREQREVLPTAVVDYAAVVQAAHADALRALATYFPDAWLEQPYNTSNNVSDVVGADDPHSIPAEAPAPYVAPAASPSVEDVQYAERTPQVEEPAMEQYATEVVQQPSESVAPSGPTAMAPNEALSVAQQAVSQALGMAEEAPNELA